MYRVELNEEQMLKYFKFYKDKRYYEDSSQFFKTLCIINDKELFDYNENLTFISTSQLFLPAWLEIREKINDIELENYIEEPFTNTNGCATYDFFEDELAFYFKLKFC